MDQLTHFIFQKDHIRPNGVGHRAFLPPTKNLQKSVFFIDDLTEQEIWECGRWVEARQRERRQQIGTEQQADQPEVNLRARGDVAVTVVIDAGLAVEPDTREHPRHANIIGWPADKDQRTAKAQLLASRATLVKLPVNTPEE